MSGKHALFLAFFNLCRSVKFSIGGGNVPRSVGNTNCKVDQSLTATLQIVSSTDTVCVRTQVRKKPTMCRASSFRSIFLFQISLENERDCWLFCLS